jgi:NADH-quinone oxidoreductase subunit M
MPWITAIVLLPLLGTLSLLAVPGEGRLTQTRIQALLATLGTLVLTAIVVGRFDRNDGRLQFVDQQDWAASVGLQWKVGVDGVSLWMLLLTAVIFAIAIGAACWRPPALPRTFLMLLLMAETGLLGLFAAGDLVIFYVFWEAMLIPFAFLIGKWGGENRTRAAIKFVVYTMVGSLLMLVAVVGTAFIAREVTGQFTFDMEALRGVEFSHAASIWLFAGFGIAFAIKLPLWPFHGWLPDAYGAAPILVTALLAAVMSKAGVYGLLRIGVPIFPEGADYFATTFLALAVIGIVYGSLVAWRAPTMRLLVAYSSLAHLGFIVLGIMAFDVIGAQGSILQMVNHGIVVAAAFVIVGVIARTADGERIDSVSGLAATAPRLAYIFLIVAMASLAIPGSNSFAGEFFILTGAFRWHVWAVVIACLGIIYASIYMLRLYQRSMNGPYKGGRDAEAVELRAYDLAILVPLVLVMLFIAFWPAALVGATERSVERAVAPAQIAADRPPDTIAAPVEPNPPEYAVPLPGDEPPVDAASGATPEATP